MVNTGYKDQIIRYVLDSSNEENERLAVFIARMRDKGGGLQAAREKARRFRGAASGRKSRTGQF
jgi:hypothetical protein